MDFHDDLKTLKSLRLSRLVVRERENRVRGRFSFGQESRRDQQRLIPISMSSPYYGKLNHLQSDNGRGCVSLSLSIDVAVVLSAVTIHPPNGFCFAPMQSQGSNVNSALSFASLTSLFLLAVRHAQIAHHGCYGNLQLFSTATQMR